MSDKAIHSYSLDRNTFIRVIEIAEKYYGMDAFYFTDQELNPTTMQGKEFSPPDYQTIYSHHTFEEQKAIFFSSESASKYVEPIPLDQSILLYYVLIAIEHALILQEDRYKFSLIGPHKDDYKFLLNGHEAKISASQGEKKSIIFSLKLSEIEIIKKNRKENPVVIIDDITSYFDEDRRKSILEFFNKRDIQVLISSTDRLNIEAKNFYVEKGIIEDENNINK